MITVVAGIISLAPNHPIPCPSSGRGEPLYASTRKMRRTMLFRSSRSTGFENSPSKTGTGFTVRISTPSSSCTSRFRPCQSVSFSSTPPPGHSQVRGKSFVERRCVRRILRGADGRTMRALNLAPGNLRAEREIIVSAFSP